MTMQLQLFSVRTIQPLSAEFEIWTDNDILLLMDGVLQATLEQLLDGRSRSSDEMSQEAWDWVMSDDILPFSFAVCCRALGYDHERLRDAILSTIKRSVH